MTAVERRRLEHEREALLARLHALPNLMRGSLYERQRKCGRASCACAQGGPKHPTRQLTVTLDGATRSRYVRLEEVAPVRALLATYEELWALVNALTAVNLALLHSTPPPGRTPPRRSPR
ncbi:MAG: DUF6788 family protein [Gemmatimonadota bacterium]